MDHNIKGNKLNFHTWETLYEILKLNLYENFDFIHGKIHYTLYYNALLTF